MVRRRSTVQLNFEMRSGWRLPRFPRLDLRPYEVGLDICPLPARAREAGKARGKLTFFDPALDRACAHSGDPLDLLVEYQTIFVGFDLIWISVEHSSSFLRLDGKANLWFDTLGG